MNANRTFTREVKMDWVILQDVNNHIYCCRLRDYEQLCRKSREYAMKLAVLCTVHKSSSYIGFFQQLKHNGFFDSDLDD